MNLTSPRVWDIPSFMRYSLMNETWMRHEWDMNETCPYDWDISSWMRHSLMRLRVVALRVLVADIAGDILLWIRHAPMNVTFPHDSDISSWIRLSLMNETLNETFHQRDVPSWMSHLMGLLWWVTSCIHICICIFFIRQYTCAHVVYTYICVYTHVVCTYICDGVYTYMYEYIYSIHIYICVHMWYTHRHMCIRQGGDVKLSWVMSHMKDESWHMWKLSHVTHEWVMGLL